MSRRDTVEAIFREAFGERASRLSGSYVPREARDRVSHALDGKLPQNRDLAFHLLDWQRDAAFLVALVLCPERFSDEEIRDEIDSLLVHIPAHVLEAARLGGYPTGNIFERPEAD